MLKKCIFLLSTLTILLFAIFYYLEHKDEAKIMKIDPDIKPIIIIKDQELIVYEGDQIFPSSNLEIKSFTPYELIVEGVTIAEDVGPKVIEAVVIYDEDKRVYVEYDLLVRKKEKEIVTIEKVIEKPIYIEKEEDRDTEEIDNVESQTDDLTEEIIYHEEVIEIQKKDPYIEVADLSIRTDASVAELNALLANSVDSNMQVSIDYSSVDLMTPGSYPVKFYHDLGETIKMIEVY